MKQWLIKVAVLAGIAGVFWFGRLAWVDYLAQTMIERSQRVQAQSLERLAAQQAARQAERDAEQQQRLRQQAALEAKARQQAELEQAFEQSYVAPEGCQLWQSDRHMMECVNHRIRARRLFYRAQGENVPPAQRAAAVVRSPSG